MNRLFSSSYLGLFVIGLFCVMMLLTLVVSRAISDSNKQITRTAMERRMRDDVEAINRATSAHSQALLSSVGLINSVEVTPEVWQRFITSYENDRAFPGIQAIGVTERIAAGDVPALESQLSSEYGRDIKIFPTSDARVLEPVRYVERGDKQVQRSVGLDMLQLKERREAMEISTKTGGLTLSRPTHVVAGNDATLTTDSRSTVFLVAPYYRVGGATTSEDSRERNIQGHAYIVFKTQKLFESIFKNNDFTNVRVMIHQKDDSTNDLLYASKNIPEQRRQQKATRDIDLFDKTYTLQYEFNVAAILSPVQRNAPGLALLFGLIISIVVPALIYILVRSRQNASWLESEQRVKRAKDELLSLASHQLRTPATATKQYIGMILQGFAGSVPTPQLVFLQKAYDSNERQLRIINDILHVAKLDSGRIVPSMKAFNVTAVAKSVIEDSSSDLKKAGITLRRRLGRAYEVDGDEYMIRMIIENLVSNAIKYTPEGGKITVTAAREENQYVLSVTDTGVGIAKADFDRLFKQFSRIPNSRTSVVAGSGVGLYLAHNLARLHGGEIRVASKVGKGSTFSLVLPKKV